MIFVNYCSLKGYGDNMISKRKVVIIGAGHVGSHVAMALCFQGNCDEIVFIDKDTEKALSNCLDISDACLFTPSTTKIRVGGYNECKDADIIIISVGIPRKPGQTRLDLLDESGDMIKDVADKLKPVDYKGIIISITNPADIIGYYLQKHLNMPRTRCFSTGTYLDTARLKRTVEELSETDRKSIDAFSMGEHGNSSFVTFSSMTVGAKKYSLMKKESGNNLCDDVILEKTRSIGNEIIEGKGSTEFGIGAACADMCKAIFHDEKRVMPASVLLEGEYGMSDVACGVPCVIGKNGIEKIIELPLDENEQNLLKKSCEIIKENTKRIEKD